jgi:outer membrane protein TolC
LTHDAQLLAAQQRALDTASQAVKLQQLRYREGATTLIELLDTQRQYQQARLGYVQAEAQRYKDSVQLLVAMGGGWWGANLAAD